VKLVTVLAVSMSASSLVGSVLSQKVPVLLLRRLFALLLLSVATLMLLRTFIL